MFVIIRKDVYDGQHYRQVMIRTVSNELMQQMIII